MLPDFTSMIRALRRKLGHPPRLGVEFHQSHGRGLPRRDCLPRAHGPGLRRAHEHRLRRGSPAPSPTSGSRSCSGVLADDRGARHAYSRPSMRQAPPSTSHLAERADALAFLSLLDGVRERGVSRQQPPRHRRAARWSARSLAAHGRPGPGRAAARRTLAEAARHTVRHRAPASWPSSPTSCRSGTAELSTALAAEVGSQSDHG